MEAMVADQRYFWGKDGKAGTPMRKLFANEAKQGMTAPTIWDDVGLNQHAAREIELIFGEKASFETPKPETLLKRIVEIATNPGDLVLDSFLGSGTTAAVAHKMGRQWIGVEMGDHAITHCAPRMVKVIDGEQGGISKALNWQGGGGFTFYRLGDPVFEEDGRIRPGIKFAALAAHIWFSETGIPYQGADSPPTSPFLGAHGGRGFALLYNGILGDKSVSGGNVLTGALLATIRKAAGHDGPITIYGEASRIGAARLKAEGVTFKQTPYDVKAR
jgi:adenine-specific DNA-methyltransferase